MNDGKMTSDAEIIARAREQIALFRGADTVGARIAADCMEQLASIAEKRGAMLRKAYREANSGDFIFHGEKIYSEASEASAMAWLEKESSVWVRIGPEERERGDRAFDSDSGCWRDHRGG